MSIFHKFLYVYLITTASLFSIALENKYPSYTYVFDEFDVDTSYLYNDDFIHFVKKNEYGLKKFYKRSLLRGETLLPMMQGILMEDGVSDLFIYLSMVESGFSTDIVSPKKAVGLWQFMPATARQYNLTVCQNYDERCDTVSATSAAIRYLNKLHKQFGKWYLAAMAYNCGEGCVQRAIRRANTDDLAILSSNHTKYLPKETRDYIKKILLIAMIGESSLLEFDELTQNDNGLIEVEIANTTSIEYIAKLINMDAKKLLALNSANGILPTHTRYHKLLIPIEKVYAFYLRYDMPMAKDVTDKVHMITHQVKMGETLESISKIYDADKNEIRVANHLEYPYLQLESILVIPVSQKIFKKVAQ